MNLENGLEVDLCHGGLPQMVRISIPLGVTVMCAENAIVSSEEYIKYDLEVAGDRGVLSYSLTSEKNMEYVFLAPEYGDVNVILRGSSFIVINSMFLFAASEMSLEPHVLRIHPQAPHLSMLIISNTWRVSGNGFALLSGYGSIHLRNLGDETMMCDMGHLLAFSEDTRREVVATLSNGHLITKIKFTGPGLVFLQTKIKP